MALIRIQEIPGGPQTSDAPNGAGQAQATISFDNGPQYPITISDPFLQKEEKELEWYFEQHLRFPFTDTVRARNAAVSVTTYGEKLFEQVFGDRKVYNVYKSCSSAGLNTLQIEIAGSPSFHRWHWEALKDPDLPQPLALQATLVRKNLTPQAIAATLRPSPTINVLVVVARPAGRQDVGYRTISRPLVESLRQTDVPIQIEILRPGTYRALDNHLREVTSKHGVGYYHVIHFDVHGAVLTFDQFQKGPDTNRYLYKGRYGRAPLQKYEGYKAFLAFEDEQDPQSDLVEAGELAQLLITHQIPIAILNACQSGKQIGASETSLGSRLMQAGVQLVLAMSYSVTVSAAEILMRTLYGQLFDKYDLATAIRHARQELYNTKERRAYFDQTILLEDWLLLVVYQNQPQYLTPRPFTPEEAAYYYEQQAASYQPTQPGYGFVGRDLDILQIEKWLLTKNNILLIRGMGGAGKTTLLQHLGTWWQSTSFVEQVFSFGYDERAWTRQQILYVIAKRLLGDVEYVRDFQPLPIPAQQAMLSKKLRATRHLLILDNLESITGSSLAIQHTLPPEELVALRSLLKDLKGGRSVVLLGSRSGEEWLASEAFGNNVYNLTGLDDESASTLTDRILEKYGVTKYREEKDLQHLIKLLDGLPLALEVVLANLARQTPNEVLTALQIGDVNLNVGDSQERTKNILCCIDYAHSNLSPGAQQLLVCLAPFTSIIDMDLLNSYTRLLKEQSLLATLPFSRWQEVIQEMKNWGLLNADSQLHSHFHIQPILPYFLRLRLNAPEQTEKRKAVEEAFRALYDQVSDALYTLLKSSDPQKRQWGMILASQEYENLMTALKLALNAQVSIFNLHSILAEYLDITQDHARGIGLGEIVLKHLENYPVEKQAGQVGVELTSVLDDIANRQVRFKQYTAAEVSYQRALTLLENTKNFDEDTGRKLSASIYHRLGIVAQEQREWDRAEQYYQQALLIEREANDSFNQASTYHQLGMLSHSKREWDSAEQYYQQALLIKREANDRYCQASTYHQLGKLAQEQRRWEQVQQHYRQALQIYIEYNDDYSQASIYYSFGTMAEEQGRREQAQQYYQQALQIYVEYNDRYSQANIYHQLGTMAQNQQHWEQAEQYYQQALLIETEANDRPGQASISHQLGMVAQKQKRWEQAQQHYQQALQIDEECGNHYSQADTYHQLGMVAQEQRRWEQAEQYYQQALQIRIEYNDRYSQAGTYGQLGLMAWEQERWEQAREYLVQAFEIFLQYKDTYSIDGTLRNLTQLWKASGDVNLLPAIASVLDETPEEVATLLQKVLEIQVVKET